MGKIRELLDRILGRAAPVKSEVPGPTVQRVPPEIQTMPPRGLLHVTLEVVREQNKCVHEEYMGTVPQSYSGNTPQLIQKFNVLVRPVFEAMENRFGSTNGLTYRFVFYPGGERSGNRNHGSLRRYLKRYTTSTTLSQ